MDKKFSISDFFSQVFMIFGITVLILAVIANFFGEGAKELSTIFRFGEGGIGIITMLQFLLDITVIVAMRYVFMTDLIIKKMPLTVRIILLFASVFAATVACIAMFGWFPINDTRSWLLFVLCFVISCTCSTITSSVKEKNENKKLSDALLKIQKEM